MLPQVVGQTTCVRIEDDRGARGTHHAAQGGLNISRLPSEPAKVTRSDELGIRDSFDQIAKGARVVE